MRPSCLALTLPRLVDVRVASLVAGARRPGFAGSMSPKRCAAGAAPAGSAAARNGKRPARACGWVDEAYLKKAVEKTIREQLRTRSSKETASTLVNGKTLRGTLTHDRRHWLLGDEIGASITLSPAYYSRLRQQFQASSSIGTGRPPTACCLSLLRWRRRSRSWPMNLAAWAA